MQILEVENISKNYKTVQALKGVSFKVPAGVVFGILGPNGSGKTTLLGIIMDVLKASSGSYKLFGEPGSEAQRKKIGTLLETPNFYHYLSAVKNLEIAAEIKGRGKEDIEHVLKVVNLHQRKDSRFNTYSLGMKQRLAIASCLLGNPDVLVFDEPTNGLDPVGIAEIRNLIKELSKQGKTIIMASHLLDEVEKVCTHVAILKKGELLASGNVNEIFVNEDTVAINADDVTTLKNIIQKIEGITRVEEADGSGLLVNFPPGKANLGLINKYCFENGVVLSQLQMKNRSLESKFIELTN